MTGIEWVLNPDGTRGITVNSKTGCLNHDNGLCKGGGFPCYAYKLANGRLKQRYLNHQIFPVGVYDDEFYRAKPLDDPFYPRFWPERLDRIRSIKKPTGIFLDDMSDWMGDYWPEEWTRQELQVMRDCPQHRFYTLTKQPQNLPQWEFPENCWVGVTATNNEMALNGSANLASVTAKIKFLSLEPLLGRIGKAVLDLLTDKRGINWLVNGACTGTLPEMVRLVDRYPPETLSIMRYGKLFTAQPRIEWVKEIVESADKAGVKVFLKDNLKPLLPKDESPFYISRSGALFGIKWDMVLRQEMPK